MADNTAIQEDLQTIREDFGRLRADIADAMHTVMEASKSSAGEARDRLEREADQRLKQLRDVARETRDQGARGVHAVESKVEERPLLSMVTAFGVGLIIGKLIK